MAQLTQSPQLLLFDDPHSEYCAKVKVVLHYKRLNWQALPAKPCGTGSTSTEFQQRVPLGKIPALIVRTPKSQPGQLQATQAAAAAAGAAESDVAGWDEVVLYESEVINEYLEDAFPEPPMLPQQHLLRAKVRLISRFHDLYLEPALRKLYPQVAQHIRSTAAVSAAGTEFVQHLRHLDQHLLHPGARLAVSDTLTLADCGYPALLLYAQLLFPVLGLGQLDFEGLGLSRVAAWHAALCDEPAVVQTLDELRPAAQEWLNSKLSS